MSEEDPQIPAGPLIPTEATIRDLIDVERSRLERDNRQLSLQEKGLELEDGQDRRHFEYATATFDANVRLQEERMMFLRRFSWVCVGFGAILVLGLLGLAFYGNDGQRVLAERIVVLGLSGVAGYGVIAAITKAVKALAKGPSIR